MGVDHVLWLGTESAWRVPYDVLDVVKRHFPSLRMLYFMDADDDGVMVTNDVLGEVFTTRFGIASEQDDEVLFDTLDVACQWASAHLGVRVGSLDELRSAIDDFQDAHGVWLALHE